MKQYMLKKPVSVNFKKYIHKTLKCPKCGSRVIDEGYKTNSDICADPPEDWGADYYIKCRVCKSEIGLKKIK